MSGRSRRRGLEYAAALSAAAFGWAATCSWRGMVVEPSKFLVPALVAALIIAIVGGTARLLNLRWYAVLGIQIVILAVWFHHRQNPEGIGDGWIPTPSGVARLIEQVSDGSAAINTYAAPVSTRYADAPVYLLACAVLVLVLIDLIACGWRLPAWAGLPALVAVTVPISVLDGGLPSSVYVATGLGFALLLAVHETDRAASWGPAVGEPGDQTLRSRIPYAALGAPALLIGTAATVIALIVSLGVPLGNGLLRSNSDGSPGASGSGRVTLSNPLVNLRRDLVRNNSLPLLDARTDARDRSYLRLTILDDFVNDSWTPSPRDLSAKNRAEGVLPNPPGLAADEGREFSWTLETSGSFETTWLPTPSVTRRIAIDQGDWRYDPNYLDIASATNEPPTGVRYELTSTSPKFEAETLASAPPPPASLKASMTDLPAVPPAVKEIAEQVTEAGTTTYAKAVLLQDFFRKDGDFTYSLAPAAGDGMEQLVRFITTDRVGYCEQFAAAMAIMARTLDIPARVVVGFLDASSTTSDGNPRYTSDDLHAWPEIYFAGAGWVRFEPTPSARTGTAPSWTRGDLDRPEPSPSPSAAATTPGQPLPAPEQPRPADSPQESAPQSQGLPVVLVVAIATMLVLLLMVFPALVRVRQRRNRFIAGSSAVEEVEALWSELRATATDLGASWPADRSPRTTANTVRDWVLARLTTVSESDHADLDEIVRVVEQVRYDKDFSFSPGDPDRLRQAGKRWITLMESSVRPRRLIRARIAPASVFKRPTPSSPVGAEADELTTI